MGEIIHLSNNTVRLRGPTNTDDDSLISTGTCIGRLFDDSKETTLTANTGGGSTVLPVFDATPFGIHDVIYVRLETGAWHDGGAVVSTDVEAKTVTIFNSLASSAHAGKAVAAKLGADITMTVYGTPVAGTFDWGFRGVILETHDHLYPGMVVRTERRLEKAGVILTQNTIDYVKGGV